MTFTRHTNLFDRKQAADIYQLVGYQFGFKHGGILTLQRTLRADMTTLVALGEKIKAL